MSRVDLVRASLWISFAFNLFAAYIFADPSSAIGAWLDLPADTHPLYRALAAYLIAAFGLSYGWLARQEDPHQPLLAFGAFGKAGVFAVATLLWWNDAASGLVVGLASGDLALALFWFWALLVAQMMR